MNRRRKASRKYLRGEADKLWRTIGKDEATCEVCNTLPIEERVNYRQVHPHHYVGRGNNRLRWDLRNRVWLCPTHHNLGMPCAQHDQEWFREWMIKNRKVDWVYCNKVKNEIVPNIDYEAIIEKLENLTK